MDNDNQKYILMIEDEENVLTLNERVLTRASGNILCFKARTLAEARAALKLSEWDYDLIILDVMLPDGSGLDFINEIRDATEAPILILSAKDTAKDVIEGTARGGDNYITKPYDPEVMAAISLAMMRREEKREQKGPAMTLACGPLTLDLMSTRAYMDGTDVRLRPKEFVLLLTLVQNEGKIVPAKKLYEAAWGLPANDDTRTVKTHVSRLRTKLSINEYTPLTITGEYGCGYRLECRRP